MEPWLLKLERDIIASGIDIVPNYSKEKFNKFTY